MSPEGKARLAIDQKLVQSGWVIQDLKHLNLFSALGIAVREFPTSTGEVDYVLFVNGTPVGVVEDEAMDKLTRFTDYCDFKYCSRTVSSFHRPETLQALLGAPDTIHNHLPLSSA